MERFDNDQRWCVPGVSRAWGKNLEVACLISSQAWDKSLEMAY